MNQVTLIKVNMSTGHLLSINLDNAIYNSKNKMTFLPQYFVRRYEKIMNKNDNESLLTYLYMSCCNILDSIIYR